ncbi:lysozyme-like isoform X1 [Glossina fuscipes]|uniref:lysozyme n=1 Tax=Glossina fuscipes TaxID=7396 RepID=A0A9C5ZED1_9MUSC|nr:lysozyme-like isoform X1 [Glossina fuscipes]KAI9576759.1 hypothetical protein GQX74_010741 [Glossina fuscipes]
MANKTFYIPALIGVLFLLSSVTAQEKPVTDICLGCICEAISGCNQTAICSGGVCGLFRITWAYWADAGKLTLGNDSIERELDYSNCVNDPYCAANTIQNYMTRFGQDCNDDKVIDCYDYAAIHKLGAYGCRGDLPHQYYQVLDTCLKYHQSGNHLDVRSDAK